MVSAPSMWMHFHGQMSTQPSHMMHSDWSMWMNCLGLTALVRSSGAISVSTYSPGKSGIGGLASVLAMSGNCTAIAVESARSVPVGPASYARQAGRAAIMVSTQAVHDVLNDLDYP